jgi:ketosteroid isomerase-like protein
MSNSRRETMSTVEGLLGEYYSGLSKKGGWGDLLSDDFLLGGTVPRETRGRDAYVNNNFFKLVRGLKVKELVASGEKAFVLVNYDLVSPSGKSFSSEVVEFWRAKDGKLVSVAIYFDTAAFSKFMA